MAMAGIHEQHSHGFRPVHKPETQSSLQ
jgi:hypothetical protein